MFKKSDKRRLYWLIDQFLTNKINDRTFCNEYYYCYDLGLGDANLTPLESIPFSELSTIVDRFSPYSEDLLQYPGVFYTESELRQKAIETKRNIKRSKSADMTMEHIKVTFEKITKKFSKEGSLELYILAQFLTSDASQRPQAFIDWLLDPSQTITGSNATDLEKRGDMVFIKDTLEEGPYFGYSISNFIHLLQDWDKIRQSKPKEIIITKDNDGKVTIEGFGKRED